MTIPASVIKIGQGTFNSCTSITGLVFEERTLGLHLGAQCFQKLEGVTSGEIIIPSQVNKMEHSAMRLWNDEVTFRFLNPDPIEYGTYTSSSTGDTYGPFNTDAQVRVPVGSLQAYKDLVNSKGFGWGHLTNISE